MKVRSPNKLATMVATAAPAATGNRAPGPSAIRAPAAMPEAGQNTATPSGLVNKRRLSRAARKYATPTRTNSQIELAHCRLDRRTEDRWPGACADRESSKLSPFVASFHASTTPCGAGRYPHSQADRFVPDFLASLQAKTIHGGRTPDLRCIAPLHTVNAFRGTLRARLGKGANFVYAR
jgi:hypothetical protein